MPARSWKNWSLFITGILILLLPYFGFPQPIKNALLILFGLLVTGVAASQLWPYHERRRYPRVPNLRKSIHKERVTEPLSTVMPATESAELSDIPHDDTQ